MAYQQVTLATLRTTLQAKADGGSPFWSNTEDLDAINESLRSWNLLTGMWKTRVVMPTVANQVWYTLASSLVYDLRMDFGSYPMEISSLPSLDNGQPAWEGETTATTGVPTRPLMFAPAGLRMFAIWPADAVGGTTLVIDSVLSTPQLAADADFIDIGYQELGALLGECLHILTFKKGGPAFEATKHYHQEFLRAAADQNGRLRASALFRRFMGLDLARSQRPFKVPTGFEPERVAG